MFEYWGAQAYTWWPVAHAVQAVKHWSGLTQSAESDDAAQSGPASSLSAAPESPHTPDSPHLQLLRAGGTRPMERRSPSARGYLVAR